MTSCKADDNEKYASYEGEIKSCIELKERSSFDEDFNPDRNCTAKYQKRSTVATSSVTTSGLFHSFYFSDKLQNYSEAGQNLRYSVAFYQKFVTVLQLEI